MKSSKDISVKKLDFSKISKEYTLGKNEFKIDQTDKQELDKKINNIDTKLNELYLYFENFQNQFVPITESLNDIKKESEDKDTKMLEVKKDSDENVIKMKEEIKSLKELVNDQNLKIKELSENLETNVKLHKLKAEQANLIKEGIESSFSRLISLKNSEIPDISELKRSHLELDNLSKNNQSEISNIYTNINSIVEKSSKRYLDSGTVSSDVDSRIKNNNNLIMKSINQSSSEIKKELSKNVAEIYNAIENKIKTLDNKESFKQEQEKIKAKDIIKDAERINREKELKKKAEEEAFKKFEERRKRMEASKKVEPKKEEPKKVEPKKEEPKKVEPKKEEPKKEEPKKVEPKKEETKKVEPKKVEPKKEETKKVEPKKVEPKKEETKKEETKKVEPKEETIKEETKKVEPKKEETKKVEPKKEETKKVEPKKEETKKELFIDKKPNIFVNDENYSKYIKEIEQNNLIIYPNSGYTLYLYVDTNNVKLEENAELSVFINGELRGKTSEFIMSNNKTFASVNVNVKRNNEEIDELILVNKKHLYASYKNYKLDKIEIGENNLDSYPNLPKIIFLPQ